ncbi:MAG: AAA family ATPase [Bacteroidales bacterium]|nr:AAA family ATPase [Bacteroidales bacterium]
MLNVIHLDDEKVKAIRSVLAEVYSPLKDCDPWLRFVFITGVTKFSQMSIFSALNNLKDVSMLPRFASLCGITLEEMLEQLRLDIKMLADACGLSYEATVEKLRFYYDGYAFSRNSPEIFNPFSVLNCLDDQEFKPYWFSTGTPTYLIEMMRKYPFIPSQFEDIEAHSSYFYSATDEVTNILPLLYQSGCMTIKGYDSTLQIYTLGVPNQEVRTGLMETLLPNYVQNH